MTVADLFRALTGTDCLCDWERIEDEDRLVRNVRFIRPECLVHAGERL